MAKRYAKVPRARKPDAALACFAKVVAFHETWGALPQQTKVPGREEESALALELKNGRRAKSLSADAKELLQQIKHLESSKESPNTGAQKNRIMAAVRAKQRELQEEYLHWCQEHEVHPGELPRLGSVSVRQF